MQWIYRYACNVAWRELTAIFGFAARVPAFACGVAVGGALQGASHDEADSLGAETLDVIEYPLRVATLHVLPQATEPAPPG